LIFDFYNAQVGNKTITITKESIDKEITLGNKNTVDQNKTLALALFLKINKDSKSINYSEGIIKSGKKLMTIYHNIGEDEKLIEYSYRIEKLAKEINDYESVSMAIIQRGTNLSTLGFFDENYKELQNAKYYTEKITDNNKRH